MTALTVFLAPDAATAGVLDVLTDLSAVGLVKPFVWVAAARVGSGAIGAVGVDRGRRRPVTLQDALTDETHDRVRICVIVPLTGGARPVSSEVEQLLAAVVRDTGPDVPISRVRCLVGRPGDQAPPDVIARLGWYNVLVAQEDAHGPARGQQVLAPSVDPVEIGRSAAPTVAGLLGLWSEVDDSPLDDGQVEDSTAVGRSFYRRIDAADVELRLRNRVLTTEPLPRPRDETGVAGYIDDPGAECERAVRELWKLHHDRLVGQDVVATAQPLEKLNWCNVWRWLGTFIWQALRGRPAAWLQMTKNWAAIKAASTTRDLVFGKANDAAYKVVAGKLDADGLPATWRDMAAASGTLHGRLNTGDVRPLEAPPDLTPLWDDYREAAFTLVDAGPSRAVAPSSDGLRPRVLHSPAQAIPASPTADHVVAGQLGADTDITNVAPGDVLGADLLRRRLHHLADTENRSLDTSEPLKELATWENDHRRTFAGQFGQLLADQLGSARDRILACLRTLDEAKAEAAEPPPEESSSLKTWMRVLSVAALLGIVVGLVLGFGYPGLLPVWLAWVIGVGPILGWLGFAFVAFLREQRGMFADMHQRATLLSAVQAAQVNLRQATIDLRRLKVAYDQLVVWNRILGVVLSEPFGPPPAGIAPAAALSFGLPRTMKVARATGQPEMIDDIAEQVRAEVFGRGWLGKIWDAHFEGAGAQLGKPELVRRPAALLELYGGVETSDLRAWAEHLVARRPDQAPGDVMWDQAQDVLRRDAKRLPDKLLSSMQVLEKGVAQDTTLEDFLAGIDAPVGRQRFAQVHFSDRAATDEAARVDPDRHHLYSAPTELSQTYVLVQLTALRNPWDFAVTQERVIYDTETFEPPKQPLTESGGGSPRMPVRAEESAVPSGPAGFGSGPV